MTKRKLAELLGSIDPALIAEAEERVPLRQKPRFQIALVAVVLAVLLCTVPAVIPFIPTTLELDYPMENGDMDFKNVWVYYTDKNGRQKSEYVRLPYSVQNVFAAWAHLSGLDESAALLEITSSDGGAEPNGSVIVTLSTALRDHPDSETLLDSLKKTFTRNFDMMKESVSFIFRDAVVLEFSHDLPTLPSRAYQGSVLSVTVTLTNVSDHDIECAVMPWSAALRLDSAIYTEEMILPTLSDEDKDITQITLAAGQSKSMSYAFDLSRATPGTYDLELSFGEYSHTFSGAVHILSRDNTFVGADAFAQFLHTYGFDTADISAFKAAVEQLTYKGSRMLEIMSFYPTEYPEGFDGWDYASDLFTYFYMRDASSEHVTKHSHLYAASAIPDGMTLPYGITAEHSLQDALLQLGFDEQAAEDLLAQKSTVLLYADGTHSLYLDYHPGIERFAIQYKQDAAINPTCSAQYCMYLYYSPDFGYEYFTVQSNSEQSTLEPARLTQDAGYEVNRTFTLKQTAWLQQILDQAEWVEGLPLYTDYRFEPQIKIGNTYVYYTEGYFVANNRYFEATSDQNAEMGRILESFPLFIHGPIKYWAQLAPEITAEPLVRLFDSDDVGHMLIILNRSVWMQSSAVSTPAYGLRVGSKECGYDPASGIFTMGNSFTVLDGEDKQFVDAIVTRSIYQPHFSSIRLSDEDAGYAIPERVALHLRTVLSSDDWYDGQLNMTPELVFDCDGTTVSYASGTFFTDGHYLYADSYTKDCTAALFTAMINRRASADAILYYRGEYYGHNDKVDQIYKDTVLPDDSGERLGDCANVVMGDASLADAMLWAIENGQSKALITDADGTTCFERFSFINPDFSKGTCRMITADDHMPSRSLTQEQQAVLREIFGNAEFSSVDSYSDEIDMGAFQSLSVFQINGYKIYYETSTGHFEIGSWHAQLSEEDQRAVNDIIGDFLAVG